jgi:hypothetical protein
MVCLPYYYFLIPIVNFLLSGDYELVCSVEFGGGSNFEDGCGEIPHPIYKLLLIMSFNCSGCTTPD